MPKVTRSTSRRKSPSPPVPEAARKPRSAPAEGDLRKEIESLLADPERWLNTPNGRFGGRTPIDLLGTEDEHLLRQWVLAMKYGMMS